MTFEISESAAIDRVSQTDGIDVTNFPLGSNLFTGASSSLRMGIMTREPKLKLVTWQMIANATILLNIDVS
jgi:myo-inositol-hexaphosphate 3-phosphohydrolase